jgi:septum formation protein
LPTTRKTSDNNSIFLYASKPYVSFPTRLILGSSSPYRRELLARLRLPFELAVPSIDEKPHLDETPAATALRLAEEKAKAVMQSIGNCVVIGCDQVADLDGKQIGKPGTHENALAQLKSMRGRTVIFHTALCVLDARAHLPSWRLQRDSIPSKVIFRDLPDADLDAYLRMEQPYDCAGSAKNEGLGIAIIESIETVDPTALTGLPLIALTSMLGRIGISPFNSARADA